MMRNELVGVLVVAVAACGPLPRPAAPQPSALSAFADMDSVRSLTLVPGVQHVFAHDPRGPWALHVIEIDGNACAPVIEARKPTGTLSARATTTALSGPAIASINADFFRLPGGTPVGAHVTGAVPYIGPTDWPMLGITADGEWHTGAARIHGFVRVGSDSARIVQVNRTSEAFTAYPGTGDGVTLFTTRADTLPPDSVAFRLMVRVLQGSERGGSGVVTAVDEVALRTVVPTGGAVLLVRGATREWAARRAAGDTVVWTARVDLVGDDDIVVTADEAVGGFPLLLRNGLDMLATQTVREAFGMARHPRTAVGWNRDAGVFYFVVVDGRQPPYSDGMTLPELTWLFRRLGATHALNLDGGGSTALVVRGALVNRPSDPEGERPVGNALSLVRCNAPAP
jgi:large repetitive protein